MKNMTVYLMMNKLVHQTNEQLLKTDRALTRQHRCLHINNIHITTRIATRALATLIRGCFLRVGEAPFHHTIHGVTSLQCQHTHHFVVYLPYHLQVPHRLHRKRTASSDGVYTCKVLFVLLLCSSCAIF